MTPPRKAAEYQVPSVYSAGEPYAVFPPRTIHCPTRTPGGPSRAVSHQSQRSHPVEEAAGLASGTSCSAGFRPTSPSAPRQRLSGSRAGPPSKLGRGSPARYDKSGTRIRRSELETSEASPSGISRFSGSGWIRTSPGDWCRASPEPRSQPGCSGRCASRRRFGTRSAARPACRPAPA